jgi:hypothetical protein
MATRVSSFFQMAAITRLKSRLCASAGRSGRSGRPWEPAALVVAGWLGLACGQSSIVEPASPVAEGRLLELPASALANQKEELLHARLELFGLGLATVQSSVCPAGAHGALTVATRVEPAALVNVVRRTGGDARTELSAFAVAPSNSEYHFRDGDLLRHYQVGYAPGGYDYVYDNGGVGRRAGRLPVPEGAHPQDMQSALMLLRAWRPRLGEEAYFYAVLGRRLWRVDVSSAGPEMIGTEQGPQLSHRIEGVAVRLWQPDEVTPRHFSVWLSEAAERVPLRVVADASFGEVSLTLTGRALESPECSRPVARSNTD